MLSIRLRRTGTTKRPYYRVVVADSRMTRDGRFVEVLGHYDPRREPAVVKIDAERNVVMVRGGVPGPKGALLVMREAVKSNG